MKNQTWKHGDPAPKDHVNMDCEPPCAMCRVVAMDAKLSDAVQVKLHSVRTSGRMRAIAEAAWNLPRSTDPAIAELYITSDGFLLARHEGDIGANDFIGTADDLYRNLKGLLEVMDVSPEQMGYINRQQADTIGATFEPKVKSLTL